MVYNENKKMSREQLSDFVRRLGFLDVGGESVKQFQEINDVSFCNYFIICVLYKILYNYTDGRNTNDIVCPTSRIGAQQIFERLHKAEVQLNCS